MGRGVDASDAVGFAYPPKSLLFSELPCADFSLCAGMGAARYLPAARLAWRVKQSPRHCGTALIDFP